LTTTPHRLYRIEEQIQKKLLHLGWINCHEERKRIEFAMNGRSSSVELRPKK